jgi:aerobic carbon-monoxide dehydrogenase large subunit
MERLIEKAAVALAMEPVELRRRNLIQPSEFPYSCANKISYDQGSYLETLDLCVERIHELGWYDFVSSRRSEGLLAGIGIACFNERTAYGTPTMAGSTGKLRVRP